jgi:hypothetical protein
MPRSSSVERVRPSALLQASKSQPNSNSTQEVTDPYACIVCDKSDSYLLAFS